MSSDITCYDHSITRFCQRSSGLYTISYAAYPGSSDKHAVDLSLAGYFCISGNDPYSGFGSCLFHGSGDLFKLVHREAFFYDKSTCQIEWLSSHACKVIDSAAYGKLSDIPSRELIRRNDKPVSRHGQSPCLYIKNSRVIRCKKRIGEMRRKYFMYKFRCLLATCSVRKRYSLTHLLSPSCMRTMPHKFLR